MPVKIQDKIYNLSVNYEKKLGLDLPYFVKNGFWMFFQQTIGSMAGLLLAIAFARLVDKDIFGQYQLAISIITFTSIIAIPGLNIAVARSVARGNDGDYPKAVKKSFRWAIWGVPVLIIAGLYYYFFKQNHILGISLISVSWIFPFLYAPNTWNGFFLGKHKFKANALLTSIQSVAIFIVIISIIFLFKNNLIFLVLAYCLIYAISNGIYYLRSLKFISNQKSDSGTVKYGYFLTLTNSLEVLSEHIDKIIIGVLLSPVHLAVFTIISFIPLKFGNFIKPFLSLFFPKLSEKDINLKIIIQSNKKILAAALCFLLAGAVAYFFLIVKVNSLFYGEKYLQDYFYSRYFIFFVFLIFPLLFLGKYAQAKKLRLAIFATGPVFVIIKAVLMVAGIYWQGFLGAILAYNLSYVIKLFFYILLTKKS